MNNLKIKHTLTVVDFKRDKKIETKFECDFEELKEFSEKFYNLMHEHQLKEEAFYPEFKILVGRKEMNYVGVAHATSVNDDEHVSVCKSLIDSVFENIVYVPVDSMLEVVSSDSIQAYLIEKYNL